MNSSLHVAICCNGTMLPGLHATLASLTRHLSRREQVELTLFFDDITEDEQAAVRGTVSDSGGVGSLILQRADVSDFKGLRALQGDWMTYLRLYLPKLMPQAATILYLDSDLIVDTDICAFGEHNLGGAPLAAVDGGTVAWSLDRDFLKTVGLTDEDRSFNAGVLLLHADQWRKTGLMERALEFGRTHTSFLKSADQTILNALFSRNFSRLPERFNRGVQPKDRPLTDTDCIYHFVGSPKPWDPLGQFFHGNWKLWHDILQQTRFRWPTFFAHHLTAYGQRAWTLRRSYLRTLRRR